MQLFCLSWEHFFSPLVVDVLYLAQAKSAAAPLVSIFAVRVPVLPVIGVCWMMSRVVSWCVVVIGDVVVVVRISIDPSFHCDVHAD